jgi:hypothetical protein
MATIMIMEKVIKILLCLIEKKRKKTRGLESTRMFRNDIGEIVMLEY